MAAELAQRRQERTALGLARRALQIGTGALTGGVVAPQIEIAFRDPEIDELLVVAAGHPLEILERGARLGIAAGAEQHRGPAEIRLVSRLDDLVLKRLQLRRGRGGIGERELVVETDVACAAVLRSSAASAARPSRDSTSSVTSPFVSARR